MPRLVDMVNLTEDERIDLIGNYVLQTKKNTAFVVDAIPGKANRYCKKLLERFPETVILDQFLGPVKGTITIKVGFKAKEYQMLIKCPFCKKYTQPPKDNAPVLVIKGECFLPTLVAIRCCHCGQSIKLKD